jgi:hypothetical protein
VFDLVYDPTILAPSVIKTSNDCVQSQNELDSLVKSSPLDLAKLSVSLKLLNSPESLTQTDKKFLKAWKYNLDNKQSFKISDTASNIKFKDLSSRDCKVLEENFGFRLDGSFSQYSTVDLSFELTRILNRDILKLVENLLRFGGEQGLSDQGRQTNNYKKYLMDKVEANAWQIGNKWTDLEIEDLVNLVCVGRVDDTDNEYGTGLQNGKYRQSLKEFIREINSLENRN